MPSEATVPGHAAGFASVPIAGLSIAEQAAGIAARLERLPLTSYQRGIFLVIATAWFFDSLDLGAAHLRARLDPRGIRARPGLRRAAVQHELHRHVSGGKRRRSAADRFGRKAVFQYSMIFWGLGSIACGLAPTAQLLGVARVLLGFGMGMEFPVAQSMISELMPAKNRGRYIAYLEGFWPIGFICSGILSLAVLSFASWRWVFILEGLPAIFVLIVRRRVPESPRWLVSRGNGGEAERVMTQIEAEVQTRNGGADLPPPRADGGGAAGIGGLCRAMVGRLQQAHGDAVGPLVLCPAGILRTDHLARRAAAAEGLPRHEIGLLHDPDFAGRCPGIPGGGHG